MKTTHLAEKRNALVDRREKMEPPAWEAYALEIGLIEQKRGL